MPEQKMDRYKLALRCAGLAALIALCGCAREPSLRSYAFSQLASGSVVVSPRAQPPKSGNYFPSIPGNLTIPYKTSPGDPWRLLAAEWQTGRYCPISPRLYKFSSSQAYTTGQDTSYNYEFNPLLPFSGYVDSEKQRAIKDLSLNENDLKYVNRISIVIKNLKIYSFDGDPFGPSTPPGSIEAGCYRYRKIYQYQIAKMYVADIDVKIEYLHGFAFKTPFLRAKILRQYMSHESGNGLVIAVQPRLISN
jgi:hypothetical protein